MNQIRVGRLCLLMITLTLFLKLHTLNIHTCIVLTVCNQDQMAMYSTALSTNKDVSTGFTFIIILYPFCHGSQVVPHCYDTRLVEVQGVRSYINRGVW